MFRKNGRWLSAASPIALLAALFISFGFHGAVAEETKSEEERGFSIFGVNISVSNPVEDDNEDRPTTRAEPVRADEEKSDDKRGLSILGVNLGASDDDESDENKKPATPQERPAAVERIAAQEDEDDEGGFSILGLSFGGSDKDEAKANAPIKDPSNTVILTIGLGYDSPTDKTPAKTAEVAIELFPKVAPKHVERIKALTRKGYYNGKVWHRVVEGFMAQTGSPTGDGIGGAQGFSNLKAEFSKLKFKRAVVGMARMNDEDSANAQFFIMFERDFMLDNKYTVIGRVIRGMDAVDRLQRTARYTAKGEEPMPEAVPDRILRAKLASAAAR